MLQDQRELTTSSVVQRPGASAAQAGGIRPANRWPGADCRRRRRAISHPAPQTPLDPAPPHSGVAPREGHVAARVRRRPGCAGRRNDDLRFPRPAGGDRLRRGARHIRPGGLYRSRLTMSGARRLPARARGRSHGDDRRAGRTAAIDRGQPMAPIAGSVTLFGAAAMGFITLARATTYLIVRVMRQRGISHDTVIVGAGRVGNLVASLHGPPRVRPLPDRVRRLATTTAFRGLRLPFSVDEAAIPYILRETGARTVIIAFAAAREEAMIDVIRECDRLTARLRGPPDVRGAARQQRYGLRLGMPLIRLRRGAHRAFSWKLKRMSRRGRVGSCPYCCSHRSWR